MRDMDASKIKTVAEAFRVVAMMSEYMADAVYGNAGVSTAAADEIAGDAAIIADRIRAAQAILDEAYPGFSAMVQQADAEAQERTRALKGPN